MPARGRGGRRGQGGGRQQAVAQDDDDEKDDRRRQKLRTLTSSNYDAWDNDLNDLAYSKDWEDVYDYALPADGVRNAAALAIDDEKKKKMWGVIKASLDDDMKDVVMDVARGDVVALLRELRDHFYKHNSQNSDRVRKQIHECHLSDYKDINAYLSRMKRLIRKAEGFGGAWTYDDKRFYVLKGLPADYNLMKAAVKMPRNPALTWPTLLEQIVEAAEADGMPGNPSEASTDTVLFTRDNKKVKQERKANKSKGKVCFQFRDHGKCARKNCPFAHVKKCAHCSKEGHWKADCFQLQRNKKQRTQTETAHATVEANDSTNETDEEPDLAFSTHEHTDDREIEHVMLSAETANLRYPAGLGSRFTLDSASTCNLIDPMLPHSGLTFKRRRVVKKGIEVGGGVIYACDEIADVAFDYKHGKKTRTVTLKDVRLVKDFGKNLMSESKMMLAGFEFRKKLVGKVGMQSVRWHGKEVMCLKWQKNTLFAIDALPHARPQSPSSWPVIVATPKTTSRQDASHSTEAVVLEIIDQANITKCYAPGVSELELWHRRLGHRNFRDVSKLMGITLPRNYKSTFCEACVQGKAKSHPRGTKF